METMLSNLANPWSLITFFIGLGIGYGWRRYQDVRADALDPAGRPHITYFQRPRIAIAMTIAVMLFVAAQTQVASFTAERAQEIASQTASAAKTQAEQNAECQRQFFETLKYRTAITTDNDKWSMIQREALANWIHDLIFPPTDIATLPRDDPQRVNWELMRTTEADRVIRQAADEQRRNAEDRARNPYPEPTCGK